MNIPTPNSININEEHWHVSYNNQIAIYGTDTTALVLGQLEYFIILNGDHRKGFQNAIDSRKCRLSVTKLGACLAYARSNKDALNKRSDLLI